MFRIYLNINQEQYEELFYHLNMNGYDREMWVTDNCLEVSEDKIYEVKTILKDRNIEYEEELI